MSFFDHYAQGKSTTAGNFIEFKMKQQLFKIIKIFLKNNTKYEILEIGPGDGQMASLFLKNDFHNYDVVEPNVLLRKKNLELGVRRAKDYFIPNLQEADNAYDLIICCDVFEHLNDSAQSQLFLNECYRVLKKNGALFICSPEYTAWKEDFFNCDFTHNNITTLNRNIQALTDINFKIINYHFIYGFFHGFIGFIISKLTSFFSFLFGNKTSNSRFYKLKLNFLKRYTVMAVK